jgi:hypothetical protein
MAISKADYINRVLLIMDETGLLDETGQSILGADTVQPDRLIEGSFVDAWRQCTQVMPRVWFESTHVYNFTTTTTASTSYVANAVHDNGDGSGFLILDDDFYLLTELKLDTWKKSVYEAYVETEKTASIQSNRYTRGSEYRPVCTLSSSGKPSSDENIQRLNFYSFTPVTGKALKDRIDTFSYIAEPASIVDLAPTNSLSSVTEKLLEPLAYLSAATVFTLLEKYDIATKLTERALVMVPGQKRTRGTSVSVVQ